MPAMPSDKDLSIDLRPVYLSAQAAIVRPDIHIDVTAYSIQHWLPRLGVVRWSLVQVLRSVASRSDPDNDGSTGRAVITRDELARLLGVQPSYISRTLLKSQPAGAGKWRILVAETQEDEYLSLFIPRLRYRYGKNEQGRPQRLPGYVIDVLMEDPPTPEDMARMPQLVGEQVASQLAQELGIQNYAPLKCAESTSGDAVKCAEGTTGTNMKCAQDISGDHVKCDSRTSEGLKCADDTKSLTLTQQLVRYIKEELDLRLSQRTQIRHALKPVVERVERILNDYHSTAMFYKVLETLYPDHLQIFIDAVQEAVFVAETDADANLGAVFVVALKEFAARAGVEPGIGSNSASMPSDANHQPEADADERWTVLERDTPALPTADGPKAVDAIWQAALEELQLQMPQATFDRWLRGSQVVAYVDSTLVIGLHNAYAQDWVENRLASSIRRTLQGLVGHPIDVKFEVVRKTPGAEDDSRR